MDEPTLGLEVVSKRDFLKTVKNLAHPGVGIIIASHQSEVIETVADDITLITHGQTQWQGSYQNFLDVHSRQMGAAEGEHYGLEAILLSLFDQDSLASGDFAGGDGLADQEKAEDSDQKGAD